MRILLDMDGVIADLLTHWCQLINDRHGENLTPETATDWNIHKLCQDPDAANKIYEFFREDGFFRELPPMPGAVEGIQTLMRRGHDVVIVTACKYGHSDKRAWFRDHLPHFNRRNIIFAERKELIRGDVFIDDHVQNLEAWAWSWPGKTAICFDAAHNRHWGGERVHNWEEILQRF